jgi:hypothetical protein
VSPGTIAGNGDFFVLVVHFMVTVFRLAKPGGLRSVLAEPVLVWQQPLILNRGRKRAPKNLHAADRFIAGANEAILFNPEQPIRRTQARSGPLPLEHSKLLAKGKHFEGSLGAAADEHPNHDQESEEE